jgi:predicted RNase H-like nuclease (RuvC/YqgF family)
MCNHIKANGEQCKNSKNKTYCHIHNWNNIIVPKSQTNENLKKEIVNLNKTIEKKAIKIKELNNNLEFFKKEVNVLNNKINLMNENCKKYELIQQYTYLKNELININKKSTPYKILSNPYYKNIIERKFNKSQDILLEEFTNLRINRNNYCH